MAVQIGHASIDERGRISGGLPGDQTGKEVCVRDWYRHPWNVLLVCTDKALAARAAEYMRAICADDDFGYDQSTRGTGFLSILRASGIVRNAAKGSFDCSSLVASCYKLAGLNINSGCTTRNLRAALLQTGKFVAYTDQEHIDSDIYAEVGAIYLKEGQHVVMALQNGANINVQAPQPTPTPVQNPNPVPGKPSYVVGNVYTLVTELRVRTGAGTGNAAKKHSQLTPDGRNHDRDKDGALDYGTKVTCKEVKNVGNDIWIRTPSGWLAAYYQGQVFIK